jgi:DNA-binding NtrC family response regulator
LSDRPILLIVEDDLDTRKMLESAFSSRFQIVLTGSASAAVEAVGSHKESIEAMILDMWIPRDDGGSPVRNLGLEVLLQTKGRPTHPGLAPEIQVVVLTGHPDLQNAIESQRLGSFRYIIKGSPNMLEELKRDVEAARGETQGKRIHRAIMDGGRLDLLQPLPLRADAPAALAQREQSKSANSHDVAELLRQIRSLSDEALTALERQVS